MHSTQTSVWQSRHSDCTASCGCAEHATGAARIDWSAAAAAEEEDEEDEEDADGDASDSAEDEAVGERGCAELRPDDERWRFSCGSGSVGGDDDALRCEAAGDFGPPFEFDWGVDGTITTLMLPVFAAALPAAFGPDADDPTPTNEALPALLWLRFSIGPDPPIAD